MNISSQKLKNAIHEVSVNDSQELFKEIYLSYYSRLFSITMYYVKSEKIAEEIVQDVFEAVWEQRAKLLEVYDFNAYIYGMTRNLSVSHIRRRMERSIDGNVIEFLSVLKDDETPETNLISKELMEKMDSAVENLPDRCKLVFKLIREENLSYKETASILNISVKTIEAHMTLAIKRLKKIVNQNIGMLNYEYFVKNATFYKDSNNGKGSFK